MESHYLNLSKNEREKRRRHGDANFGLDHGVGHPTPFEPSLMRVVED
jgi:hypothetical protein